MTGFGKSEVIFPDKKVTVEIKSLNSKNSDVSLKLPFIYRGYEGEIRKIILEKLDRGKIEFNIYIELNAGITVSTINEQAVKSFYVTLKKLSRELDLKQEEPLLSAILRLPEVIKSEKSEPDEKEWELVRNGIVKALDELDQFRIQEGIVMKKDIQKRISLILANLDKINKFEAARIDKIRKKFINGLGELKLSDECDKNRFEQEIIYFLEKIDFTEEKIRLRNHCEFFMDTLNQPESAGKKLGFISQEIGREINTLGSKAFDSDIQKLVVEMKDDLEKIKEQLLNVL